MPESRWPEWPCWPTRGSAAPRTRFGPFVRSSPTVTDSSTSGCSSPMPTVQALTRLEADLQARGIALLCCPAEPPAEPEVEIYALRRIAGRSARRLAGCSHASSHEGGNLRTAPADARRSEAGGRRERNDDHAVARESSADVSVVPGDHAASRPDRGASPDSLTCVPAPRGNPLRTETGSASRGNVAGNAGRWPRAVRDPAYGRAADA